MLRKFLIGLIDAYRAFISPHRFPSCRFVPSCSVYARQSIEAYGALAGVWSALARLFRCHPFQAGGYDPVRRAP